MAQLFCLNPEGLRAGLDENPDSLSQNGYGHTYTHTSASSYIYGHSLHTQIFRIVGLVSAFVWRGVWTVIQAMLRTSTAQHPLVQTGSYLGFGIEFPPNLTSDDVVTGC